MDLLTATILVVAAWIALTLLTCLILSLVISAAATDIVNSIHYMRQRLESEVDHVRVEIKVNRDMMVKWRDDDDS
jgi:cell division protein FtsL